MVIIRKLLRQAATRLQPHGVVVIEVGGLRDAINREYAALKPEWLATEDSSNCVVAFRARNFPLAVASRVRGTAREGGTG